MRQLDLIRVKGKMVPIHIYELMGSADTGRLREAAGLSDAGFQAYLRKDWDKAESSFKKTLEILPNDGPATTFLKRIAALREQGVPADWDGVFVMTKK